MKKLWALIALMALLCGILSGCAKPQPQTEDAGGQQGGEEQGAETSALAETPTALLADFDADDLNADWQSADPTEISLNGDSIEAGYGVATNGSTVTISEPGCYHITGSLDDGSIVVESPGDGKVWLVLDDASISCSDSAPINIREADRAVITLVGENSLADGASYTYDNDDGDEPSACLFSKDDLAINGAGSLAVTALCNNGIAGKDDLRISGGSITVSAPNDGIKGKDSLQIIGGSFAVEAGDDALCADNSTDEGKGYVIIENGAFSITAGDDALHADGDMTVSGGSFDIAACYEGVEGATVAISGGSFSIVATDDAVNSAGGSDSESANDFRGGFEQSGCDIYISGGSIVIDAGGDGIDANGSVYMSGGDIVVHGPANDGNGALDYTGVFEVSGGSLAAAGSSGMAMSPSNGSTLNSISIMTGSQSAGTVVELMSSAGETVAAYTAKKSFSHLVFSGEYIQTGKSYTIFVDGVELGQVEVSSVITNYGSAAAGMMGGGRGQMWGQRPEGNVPGQMPEGKMPGQRPGLEAEGQPS